MATKALKPVEEAFWRRYLATLPNGEAGQNFFVEASFAGNAAITDELLALYLLGKKTAGSSVVEDFLSAKDPLPKVGNFWILLNSKGDPGCLLRTERVAIQKFKDLPEEISIAEGEGDLSVKYWKKVHGELYRPHLSKWGLASLDEATIITEFFKFVFR